MAIENKKMKDPTEAALSAIEQALNLEPVASLPKNEPGELLRAAVEPRLPDIEEHDFTSPLKGVDPAPAPPGPRAGDGVAAPRPAFVAPDRPPANDDRQNVGFALQALQVRPSRRAYVFATLVSLLWLGGLGYLAHVQGIATPEALLSAYSTPQLAIGGFVLLAPVLLFFITAMLAVRSQEMKLVARAVGEVAVRLAQPE